MADNNPANFANLPKDQLREIAAMGGHASHGGQSTQGDSTADHHPGRNPDGTFTKGSEVAKELGSKGGHASGDDDTSSTGGGEGRNPDGTFKSGSKLASELGTQGGHASHKN